MAENKTTALAEAEPDLENESWGSRTEIATMGNRLKAMLPGVKNAGEATRLAQAAVLSRANPFRGELYIFGDNIVEGYKLLVRWAKRQEDYTATYTQLAADDPQMGQVKAAKIGYVCELWRDSVKADLVSAVKAGIPYEVAATMFQPERAVGIVTQSDMNREPPKGWSWDQVAKKRALKNALNLAYGMPSPDELVRESWTVDGQHTEAEDWQGAEELNPDDAAALAKSRARWREHNERLETDPEYREQHAVKVAEGAAALFGTAPAVEAEIVEAAIQDEAAEAMYPEAMERNAPEPTEAKPQRPYTPFVLHDLITLSVERRRKSGEALGPKLDNFKRAVVGNIESCFEQHADQARHLVVGYLLGSDDKASSKAWDDAETMALHRWMNATEQDGVWTVDSLACQEAHSVLAEAMACKGQMGLFGEADPERPF